MRTTMQKYYLAFGILALVCVVSLIWYFVLSRGSASDQKKVTDISSIQTAVDNYAQDQGKAPDSLEQIKLEEKIKSRLKDYEYSHSTDTFTICTNFKTDASADNPYGDSDPYYHGKGRQCFTSNLYLYNASDLPYPSPEYEFDDYYNQDTTTQFDSLYQ